MDASSEAFKTALTYLQRLYEERLPFNRVLGIRVLSIDAERVLLGFDRRPDLVGNYVQGSLHGGVVSSVLDALGGMVAAVGVLERIAGRSEAEIEEALTRMGTIDLRVDFLRPGRGSHFIATGSVMRAGRKVAVTRMELHNDQGILIAVGTGTYLVG